MYEDYTAEKVAVGLLPVVGVSCPVKWRHKYRGTLVAPPKDPSISRGSGFKEAYESVFINVRRRGGTLGSLSEKVVVDNRLNVSENGLSEADFSRTNDKSGTKGFLSHHVPTSLNAIPQSSTLVHESIQCRSERSPAYLRQQTQFLEELHLTHKI